MPYLCSSQTSYSSLHAIEINFSCFVIACFAMLYIGTKASSHIYFEITCIYRLWNVSEGLNVLTVTFTRVRIVTFSFVTYNMLYLARELQNLQRTRFGHQSLILADCPWPFSQSTSTISLSQNFTITIIILQEIKSSTTYESLHVAGEKEVLTARPRWLSCALPWPFSPYIWGPTLTTPPSTPRPHLLPLHQILPQYLYYPIMYCMLL